MFNGRWMFGDESYTGAVDARAIYPLFSSVCQNAYHDYRLMGRESVLLKNFTKKCFNMEYFLLILWLIPKKIPSYQSNSFYAETTIR